MVAVWRAVKAMSSRSSSPWRVVREFDYEALTNDILSSVLRQRGDLADGTWLVSGDVEAVRTALEGLTISWREGSPSHEAVAQPSSAVVPSLPGARGGSGACAALPGQSTSDDGRAGPPPCAAPAPPLDRGGAEAGAEPRAGAFLSWYAFEAADGRDDVRVYCLWSVPGAPTVAGIYWGPHPQTWDRIRSYLPRHRYLGSGAHLKRYGSLAEARAGWLVDGPKGERARACARPVEFHVP